MLRPLLTAAVIGIILLTACHKSSSSATPTFTAGYSVYMAGTSNGKVVYWKNGTMVDLGSYGMGQAITMSGTDLYVGGYIVDNANMEAAYWLNGQLVQLEGPGTSHVYGMAVNGSDVYCVGDLLGPSGSERDSATYWKNGVRMHLSPADNGLATGIFVAGTEMYVSGEVWGTPGASYDTGVLWRNGVQSWYAIPGSVNGVALVQSDTLLFGQGGNQALYGENGTGGLIPNSTYASGATVYGTDVFFCGGNTASSGSSSQAIVWKDGTANVLACPYPNVGVSGIAYAGADQYVVGGIENNGKAVPVYWKNGVMNELSDSGTVNAVYVGQ